MIFSGMALKQLGGREAARLLATVCYFSAGGLAGALISGVAPLMPLVAGSVPSSPILFRVPISAGAVAPISGGATFVVGGSLPSSPNVFGGAIGVERSS
jgi:hypothetical protein